jgi:uncharacterized protein (DUF924 family)
MKDMAGREDQINAILEFWFAPGNEANWFKASSEFDMQIDQRFGYLVEPALAGALDGWRETDEGALALILLLDQFTRNLFRGTSKAFSGDAKARSITRLALGRGFDRQRSLRERLFFYLPLGHSEDLVDQDEAVQLAGTLENDVFLGHARHYRDVIARFGRFPHRNAALGRENTEEEHLFLQSEG